MKGLQGKKVTSSKSRNEIAQNSANEKTNRRMKKKLTNPVKKKANKKSNLELNSLTKSSLLGQESIRIDVGFFSPVARSR
jgi:hypothetical protein